MNLNLGSKETLKIRFSDLNFKNYSKIQTKALKFLVYFLRNCPSERRTIFDRYAPISWGQTYGKSFLTYNQLFSRVTLHIWSRCNFRQFSEDKLLLWQAIFTRNLNQCTPMFSRVFLQFLPQVILNYLLTFSDFSTFPIMFQNVLEWLVKTVHNALLRLINFLSQTKHYIFHDTFSWNGSCKKYFLGTKGTRRTFSTAIEVYMFCLAK